MRPRSVRFPFITVTRHRVFLYVRLHVRIDDRRRSSESVGHFQAADDTHTAFGYHALRTRTDYTAVDVKRSFGRFKNLFESRSMFVRLK